ncbi:hypothetical protein PGQ11_013872 [Apiospora arundinis]|uniref:Uncharacterized protein n=1 Tax=Apiospora arundinis TaxID=335852 RepID=A0ABR2HR43_9PEZI
MLHHPQGPCRRGRAGKLRHGLPTHEHAPRRDRVDKGAHHPLVDLARQRLRTPRLLCRQRLVPLQPEGRSDGAGMQTAHGARGGRPADLGLETLQHPRNGAGAGPLEGLVPVEGAVLQTQGIQERRALHGRLVVLQGKLPTRVHPVHRHLHVARAYGVP